MDTMGYDPIPADYLPGAQCCRRCGAVVWAMGSHDAWHERVVEAVESGEPLHPFYRETPGAGY